MLDFQPGGKAGKHECKAEVQGDWVVFRCPHCPDFERKIHRQTGEMLTQRDPNNMVGHYGTYMKPGFDVPMSPMN